MWTEPVDLFGSGLIVTLYQFALLVGFIGLVVGYLLAVLVNMRQKTDKNAPAVLIKERAMSNVAFMKGINYILTEKRDLAIEELTRAVSVDTETLETYVALGNLFRSKGEIERAVRIRQSILLRSNITEKERLQTLLDLALDYRRGGFFERAISTFEEILSKAPKHAEALRQLVAIYEDTRDWNNAFQTAEKLARLTGERLVNVLAHYQVEMGKEHFDQGRLPQAKAAYKKALALDPRCVDAYLHFGDLHVQEGKTKKALSIWHKVIDVAPDMIYLTFSRLARMTAKTRDLKRVEAFLSDCVADTGNPLAHQALAVLLSDLGRNERALEELKKALGLAPYLIETRRQQGFLLLSLGRNEEALAAFTDLLHHLPAPEETFQCGHCGLETSELMWRCPRCCNWDTMTLKQTRPRPASVESRVEDPMPLPPVDEPAPEPERPDTEPEPDQEVPTVKDST